MKKFSFYFLAVSVKFILVLTTYSCNSQNCNELPTKFNNYSQALNEVKSANFNIKEKVKTTKSSWIKSISFYSCDSEHGYLIVVTEKRKYIYQNVPISIWDQFKTAKSYGSFYNKNIKNKYTFILNHP